jgi:hypothetical protein
MRIAIGVQLANKKKATMSTSPLFPFESNK